MTRSDQRVATVHIPVRERTALARRSLRPRHGAYAKSVLRKMRDPTGGPTVRIRLVALLAAAGLLVVTAPVVVPLVRWIADLVW